MARTQYGTTWWGKQWLDALSGIDYSNRIPRGKTYANTGKVMSYALVNKSIKARVRGHFGNYNVLLCYDQLTKQQIDNFIDKIRKSPVVLASLSNRELDPEVLEIATKCGIKMLPETWTDLHMTCSCPDFAVPCKHLAAVIYIVSKEIDVDPFFLFKLRGIDILEELKKRGINFDTAKDIHAFSIDELFASDENEVLPEDPPSLQSLSLERLPYFGLDIVSLFDNNPPGYVNSSIKEQLEKVYSVAQKYTAKILKGIPSSVPVLSSLNEEEAFITFDEKKGVCVAKPAIFKNLNYLYSQTELEELSEYSELFYRIWFLALKLVERGAIIPQFYEFNKKEHKVRYIPAIQNDEIAEFVKNVGFALKVSHTSLFVNKINPDISALNLGINVLSVFIDGFMLVSASKFAQLKEVSSENDTRDAIFSLKKLKATKDNHHILASLDSYLTPISLSTSKLSPVIAIEDLGGEEINLSYGFMGDDRQLVMYAEMTKDELSADIMRLTSKLFKYIEPLKAVITKKVDSVKLSLDTLNKILISSIPPLRLLGVKVILPKSLQKILKPTANYFINVEGKIKGTSFVNLSELLSFNWRIAIDGTPITEEEFSLLQEKSGQLIRFHDQFVRLDPEEMQALIKQRANAEKRLSKQNLLMGVLTGSIDNVAVSISDQLREVLDQFFKEEYETLPKALNAQLRPYQERGFNWLYKNCNIGIGSIIADDMGLGKTLQVISVIEKLRENNELNEQKVLVVVPTALIINWQHELRKFAPMISYNVVHGNNLVITGDSQVILTTYGKLRSDPKLFNKRNYRLLVIDEAQNIKNTGTQTRNAVVGIKAQSYIAMSGTPVENRLSEYWSILDFANPKMFGSLTSFVKEYAKPIEVSRDPKALAKFKRLTAPFIIRRLKSDKSVISDLPEKLVSNSYCNLSVSQASLYESFLNEQIALIEQAEAEGGEQSDIVRCGMVLKLLSGLKQICNAPSCYLDSESSDYMESGKGQLLLETIHNELDANHKILIFTQYTKTGDLIQKWISENTNTKAEFLYGGLSIKERQRMVDDFQNNKKTKIMILSIRAAGTGLNLTAASTVIHYDLWWNPAVENQATDRAYRIGQKNNVNVLRFITANTFEEKIDAMIQNKKELSELTVGEGENWIGNLSTKELKELFTLTSD